MALLCRWKRQSLEDMTSLRTDFEMHAIWQGYVDDPAAMDFVARKARIVALSKAQGSCHRISNNQPYSQVWKSLGDSLPKRYCITQRGLCHARKWSLRIFVSKKGMICIRPMDIRIRNFGKRRKGERSPVVNALPGSHERLALRNPCILCQEYGGARTTYYLRVPKVRENGSRNWIPVQPRKARRN
jgi:hypothetical protein